MVRARPVETSPKVVAATRTRRTDVGVTVVAIHSPGRNASIGVSVFSGAPYVIHDPVAASLPAFAHFSADFV